MTSTFSGLSIALSSLMAQRVGIEAAGHNVANANTPGFSRQDVVLEGRVTGGVLGASVRSALVPLGTGVDVVAIRRLRDALLDGQIRQQASGLGRWETTSTLLGGVEYVFAEPVESNLGALLGKFWSAWEELGNAPQNAGARSGLVGQAQTLAHQLNQSYERLIVTQQDLDARVSDAVREINGIAAEVARLNGEILHLEVGGAQANDLRDQRDLLLDRLAELTSFATFEEEHGAVAIYVGGSALVDGVSVRNMEVAVGGTGFGQVVWKSDGQAVSFADGRLQALLQMRDLSLPAKLAQLDALALALIDGVNALHRTGYGLDGTNGRDFFTGSGAHDVAVNEELAANPSLVAAAAVNAPGDGSLAQLMADLRHATVASLGGRTVDDFYAALVTQLGTEVRQAADRSEEQTLVVQHLESRREAVAGVNLDEEAANMVRFQQAYAAAAQYLATVDAMLDVLINRVGASGR